MTNYQQQQQQDYQDYQEFNKYRNLEKNDIPIVVLGADKKSLRNNNLTSKIITIALTGVITVIIIMLIYTLIKYFEDKNLRNKVKKSTNDQKYLQKDDDDGDNGQEKQMLYDMNSNVVVVGQGSNTMVKTTDIFEVDSENKLQVKENFKNTPFIVIFYANWCPHCVNAAPHFQNAANKSKNNVVYFAIEEKHIPANFPIRGYPTLYVWNGDRLGIFKGAITEEKLIDTANDLFEQYESYKIETEK